MISDGEAKNKIKDLTGGIIRIEAKAKHEGRELTREESSLVAEMQGAIDEYSKELPAGKPLTVIGFNEQRHFDAYALKGPSEQKDWKSLFGNRGGYSWPDRETNFFSAMFSGRHHEGLIRASMTETIPSDGGFLVPVEQAAKIHAVSLENEIVQPRCYVQPMISNTCKIPAMSIGDHGTALFGGFTASYTAETGTITEHSPKARSMTLDAKKLTGLIRFSSELSADTPGGMGQIETLCGRGLAWYRDRAFLKGIGAGEPLGILNAPCTIAVSKESGQAAGTIVYENLTKIMGRLFAGSFQNSVWVAHQTTIPQLLSLSIGIGTGGSHIPVMGRGANGGFEILTRPVLFTEKVETLGTQGDIGLFDFSQYVVGLRSEMRFDTSIHVAFTTDEILSRIIERHDGQPLWDAPLTLADGVTTVSPFVLLESRT